MAQQENQSGGLLGNVPQQKPTSTEQEQNQEGLGESASGNRVLIAKEEDGSFTIHDLDDMDPESEDVKTAQDVDEALSIAKTMLTGEEDAVEQQSQGEQEMAEIRKGYKGPAQLNAQQ